MIKMLTCCAPCLLYYRKDLVDTTVCKYFSMYYVDSRCALLQNKPSTAGNPTCAADKRDFKLYNFIFVAVQTTMEP